MITDKPRVVALWGAHRRPAQGIAGLPSSLDKGMQELSALGHEVVPFYPLLMRDALPGIIVRLLRGKALYKTSLLNLVNQVKTSDVLYTSDSNWSRHISQLKKWGVIKNRFIYKWAGFDAPWDEIKKGKTSPAWQHYWNLFSGADAVFFASEKQRQLVHDHFPVLKNRLCFWPTAVDIDFYQQYESPRSPEGSPHFVAVGSDCKRDWPFIFKLAEKGIAIKMITTDPRVKQLPEKLGASWPATLSLEFDVGFARSAELIADSSGLIIATLQNDRFSGSTTVGVAAAMGKPLVLDEQYDLAAYGLEPGKNCEWYPRGDIDAACAILRRVLTQSDYAHQLGAALKTLAPGFGTVPAAKAISAACLENWTAKPFMENQVPDSMQT